MRTKRLLSILSVVFLIVSFAYITAVQATASGFSTQDITAEEENTFLSHINLTPVKEAPEKGKIQCFDVNEQGLIAVGQNGFQDKEVCIYTSRGEFLYGYRFDCNQSFCVEWDEQTLNLYFVRSGILLSVDAHGQVTEVKAVPDTIDNNTHENSLLYSTERVVGDVTYIIRNDMGPLNWVAPSYSQILKVGADGTESIIYDVNSKQLLDLTVTLGVICIIIVVAIVCITRESIRLKRKKRLKR